MSVRARVRLGGRWVTAPALLDSGAEVNLIHPRLLGPTDLAKLDDHVAVSALFNAAIQPLGSCDRFVKVKDAFGIIDLQRMRFVVADIGELDMILGFPWLEAADPIVSWKRRTFVFPMDSPYIRLCVTKKEIRKALQECRVAVTVEVVPAPATVEGSGEDTDRPPLVVPPKYAARARVFSLEEANTLAPINDHAHAIDLEDAAVPPHGPIYPLAEPELEVLREYLNDAIAKGWIRPSRSPAGAPILFVPKKGGQLRLCVDYRALNRITRKNRAPLPLIGEILDRLSKAKIYTKLDLRDAYHRIRIKLGDEWKTAFRCRYGHFEYCVMPFGLANAPATFQSFINEVLGDLVDSICIVYLDDILIYSQNEEEHTQHVHRVLERLEQHDLFAKLEKCAFDVREVSFLGYIISPAGIHMEPSRVAAIQSWPVPQSVKDIQVFLGFTGFYRRFIKGYSKITTPLTDHLRGKNIGWLQLGSSELEAFAKLKVMFSRAPFLHHYDPALPTRIETDASAFAIGAVLSQLWEGRWHPIAFLSRKLKGAELRYDTPDAELMAIVEAFRAWRPYLAYVRETVVVLTDHLNHRYLATKAKLSWRQARWMQELAVFDFNIEYREGKKNPADGLSRRPDHWDSSEAVAAKKAPLASFIERFVIDPGCGESARVAGVRCTQAASSPLQSDLLALRRGRKVGSVGELIRRLNLADAVGLARVIGYGSSVASNFQEEPVHRLEGAKPHYGVLQRGELVPRREVQGGQELWELPATTAGGANRESYYPWPRVLKVGDATRCTVSPGAIVGASGEVEGLITATAELLPPLVEALRDAQKRDAFVAEKKWTQWRSSRGTAGSMWTYFDDLLRFRDRVYVPDEPGLREEILKLFHDDPTAGHQGVSKTIKRLAQSYFWQSIHKDVRRYVSTCAICQRTKARTHRPYGELAVLPIPKEPWREISLDFITQLPPSLDTSGRECNSILVIVDRFTKYALYIATSDRLTSDGLATLLCHHIFRMFGVPDGIVSDRGSLFTSHFWASFCWHLATTRRLSTAFHPQTDGQTERQNQSLEHYLRVYCNLEQDDWARRLWMAEFVYNTSYHSATSATPAMALLGFHPRGPNDVPSSSRTKPADVPTAEERARQLRDSRNRIVAAHQYAQTQYQKWYNKGRKPHSFKKDDWVMLSTKHLRQRRPSRKLANKFEGPFQIEKVVGDHGLAYQLRLPQRLKIHPTFPITSLEPYRPRSGEAPASPLNTDLLPEPSYEVEAILGHEGKGRNRRYLIKWKGYDHTENTLEPRRNIDDGPLIQDYLKSIAGT